MGAVRTTILTMDGYTTPENSPRELLLAPLAPVRPNVILRPVNPPPGFTYYTFMQAPNLQAPAGPAGEDA